MRIVILFFLLIFSPSPAFAQPSIIFDSEYFDFGTISQTDKINHVFDFTNSGNEELVIEKLVPS